MIFVVRMAMREVRASWRRLLFFFICIAVGVGSIVALRSLIQSVRVALAGEARTLLGADVLVSSNRAWSQVVLDTLDAEAAWRPRDAAVRRRSRSRRWSGPRSHRILRRGWWS